MPHINRIRVNNVKYNFGTQFYDDFILRFDGKNALYDLANGGGKSVLMLLLFQTLIPNCTLDEKQPVEKLFRTDQGSTVIHSLVEWRLDERFIKEDYRYMLTGFCARKAREELRETAAIEYFNYVIFYRGYNDNDLVNLPLSNNGKRVTYTELKNYLKELGRRDMGLDVHVFDRKGEYQRFISHYGLYESHWEILRGINKTEGHVRTYFENRYKTTRRVVEDLLIEEVIQRAFRQTGGTETDMADTLVQIKDKLTELAARREEINYYDRQAEVLQSFSGRVKLLKEVYEEKESLDTDFVRTWHTLAARNRMKERELAGHQKEKEFAQKHILEVERKLDTVKIQENQEHLKRLEADTEKYASDLLRMKRELEEQQKNLALAESLREYREYLQLQSKAEALKAVLSHGSGDNDGILSEMQSLARIRFRIDRQKKQELDKKILYAGREREKALLLQRETGAQERTLFGEGEILKSRLMEADEKERERSEALNRLCLQVPILVLENISKTLAEKKQQRDGSEKKYIEATEKRRSCEENIRQLTAEIEENTASLKTLETEMEELRRFMENYSREKEKRDKLLQIYRAVDDEALDVAISEQMHRVILDSELKRREIDKLEKQLENLQKGSPAVMSPAAEEVIDYIRRCHGVQCVFGGEYLKDFSDSDKKSMLERFPFLPESVVINGEFSAIREDRNLLEKDLGGALVPVISLAQIMQGETVTPEKDILFLSQNPEWYTDTASRQSVCERVGKALEEAGNALKRLTDRERTMIADRRYIAGFEVHYQQYLSERSERWALICKDMDTLKENIREARENISANREMSEQLRKNLPVMEAECRTLDSEIDILEQMQMLDGELTEIQEKQHRLKHLLKKNADEQQSAAEKLKQIEKTVERLTGQVQMFRENKEQMESTWRALYEAYYTPGDVPESTIPDCEIDARFAGLKEAYEKEHLDLEDKKQLLENYNQMMAASLNRVQKQGVSIGTLEEMVKADEFLMTDDAALEMMAEKLREMQSDIEQQEELFLNYRADKDRLYGSVDHGIHVIEEKYGDFQTVEVADGDYAAFSDRQRQALTALREKSEKAEAGIQSVLRELRAYEDVKRELEHIFRSENIPFNRTQEIWSADVDVRWKYRDLNGKYQRLSASLQQKRQGFVRDKEKAVESLRLLAAPELSETLRTEAVIPETASAAGELIRQLLETVNIVRLEKERIEKSIRDMAQMKAGFEQQCLQRCLSIRAELERFPAYSRIMLDGKPVPMVMLKIPYVKEEMYAGRMSEYIDALVARADKFASPEERTAYIRQQLSWKRLFSVIVSDMNRIRLKLYKRERVKEQSRYLKYEEAVGSTGQSQGIYIQFLIGVINYISMVYSGGGDGADLKKVVFIDNPFGAAKDIYIWEPIFELLKTNHVQLIVPTRGATPAITGKFDVNYILGQKMIDRMQQTVVVDYSSNVDVASLEYERLEFEQEVFDFI